MPALDPQNITQHAQSGLKSVYVIHGEEELIRIESLDTLRHIAKQKGYLKESHSSDSPQFTWENLNNEINSMGLFSDKKWVEIHIPSVGKINKQAGDIIAQIAENTHSDISMVFVLPKLTKTQIQSKWFSTLAKHAQIIEAKEIKIDTLPEWIKKRLYAHKITIEDNALQWFAQLVEGNLLAAKQEIDKLALLYPSGATLKMSDIEQTVAHVARFDVFQLAAAWMSGDTKRTVRLLDGLQNEHDEPILPLWAVCEDIRMLLRLTAALKQGKTVSQVRNELQLWGDKQKFAPKAIDRLPAQKLLEALQQCAQIDRQIKGAENGNAWANFKNLLLKLAA